MKEIKTDMLNAVDAVADAKSLRQCGREYSANQALTVYRNADNTVEVEVSIVVRGLSTT